MIDERILADEGWHHLTVGRVGDISSVGSASDAFDFMTALQVETQSFDADVTRDIHNPNGVLSNSFLGEWTSFAWGDPIPDEVQGWFGYYAAHNSLATRLWSEDQIMRDTEGYNLEFLRLYDKAVNLGMTPSRSRPNANFVGKPPSQSAEQDLFSFVRGLLPWAIAGVGIYVAGPIVLPIALKAFSDYQAKKAENG